jgi:hypothetical protein
MTLIEAASKAAAKVHDAVFQLDVIGVFSPSDKRSKQYYRLMQFYGLLLRDLSDAQDLLLLELTPPSTAAESAATAH